MSVTCVVSDISSIFKRGVWWVDTDSEQRGLQVGDVVSVEGCEVRSCFGVGAGCSLGEWFAQCGTSGVEINLLSNCT